MAVRYVKGRWLVEFMQNGHRVFKRLPEGASRQDATAYETKLRREIFDQLTLGKKPEIPLEYAIKEWLKEVNAGRKSERATESHARAVLQVCGESPVGSAGIVGGRIGGHGLHSVATRNRRLCILKAVAKFAWRKGWTEENLSPRIQLLPENNARHIYLELSEVEALIEKAETREAKAFIAIAAFTGLRQGEVMALLPDDIDASCIHVRESKTGLPRAVPIIDRVREYLAEIPFRSHKRTLYAQFEKARKSAVLQVRYHDLRHTTASLMIQAGVPLYTVGEILGHKSIQTTKRYAHLVMENKREALEMAFAPSKLQRD